MSLAVRRKFMCVSGVLCVVRVVLVLRVLLTESYTTREPFRVDGSGILVSDSFTLSPNNNRTYTRATTGTNSSIFQIDINSTDALIFKIVRDGLLGYRVDFERRIGGGSGKVRYFWTPPFPSLWLFVFDNTYKTSIHSNLQEEKLEQCSPRSKYD